MTTAFVLVFNSMNDYLRDAIKQESKFIPPIITIRKKEKEMNSFEKKWVNTIISALNALEDGDYALAVERVENARPVGYEADAYFDTHQSLSRSPTEAVFDFTYYREKVSSFCSDLVNYIWRKRSEYMCSYFKNDEIDDSSEKEQMTMMIINLFELSNKDLGLAGFDDLYKSFPSDTFVGIDSFSFVLRVYRKRINGEMSDIHDFYIPAETWMNYSEYERWFIKNIDWLCNLIEEKCWRSVRLFVTGVKASKYYAGLLNQYNKCCNEVLGTLNDIFADVEKMLEQEKKKICKEVLGAFALKRFGDADDYQKEALRTAAEGDNNELLINGLMGLCGEAGECIDILKKHKFQGHKLDKEKLKEELGDVAWYLAIASEGLGYKLSDILDGNIEKLKKRYPDGFDTEKSINRSE